MDKITKIPDSAKFTDSPRSSNVDAQIEKFRLEISKKSESDFINTRKLTIQSTVKNEAPTESNEIDRQISDLEILIRRLQDEIVEMSNNANKPYQLPTEESPPVKTEDETNEKESHESEKSDDATDTVDNTGHVYPVIIRDMGYIINDQSQKFAAEVSDLVNFPSSSDENTIPKTFSSIRRNIGELWNEENMNNDRAGESKAAEDDYHLQKLIGELKTEISEKLETLKDATKGEPLNNSETDFNINIGQS